jgi:MoxR-like ATPase
MEERQVTLDGQTHKLPDLFMVVATQNPVEFEGTYPLPEAQLDRFMLKISDFVPRRRCRKADVAQLAIRPLHPFLHRLLEAVCS